MRISVGKILLQEPGLLLLDEPTNHIDLNTIQWLESYLKNVDVPLVCVSHDREFLDQICNKIVEVEQRQHILIEATTRIIEEKRKRKRCKRTLRGRNGIKKSRDKEN